MRWGFFNITINCFIISKRNTYNKQEKLKSRNQIDALFSKGKSFLAFPVKVIYAPATDLNDVVIKAGVSASKRNFKRAVHRNRVKRLLREAYRVNKHPLQEYLKSEHKQVVVFFLYIDKVLPTLEVLNKKMQVIIQRIIKELNETVA